MLMMASPRRRTTSARSTGSITPADELTSWLGDDVCTNCGANVHAGQLYCSQQCREEDGEACAKKASASASTSTTSSGSNAAASTSAPVLSNARGPSQSTEKRSSSRSPNSGALQRSTDKFRYVCPPSPNILAKYHANLTSPALAALDRSGIANKESMANRRSTGGAINKKADTNLTTTASGKTSDEREWMSSSEESAAPAAREMASKRRSSSRSTFSSVSDAISTDPSTPSPSMRVAADDEDLDDIDGSDFNLPPSVLLNPTARGEQALSNTAAVATRWSPVQKHIPLSSQQPRKDTTATMSYARRPSSTNLPAPVLFTSPVLATTMMKASAARKQRSQRRSEGDASSTPGSASPSHPSSSSTSPLVHQHPSMVSGQKRLSPVHIGNARAITMNRRSAGNQGTFAPSAAAQLLRRSPTSPPMVASASSSAGRTLRAVSPTSRSMSPLEHGVDFVCGRFGCQGLSLSSSTGSPEVTSHEATGIDLQAARRPSMLGRHKHTHSASAGLNFLPGLTQTPAAAATTIRKLKLTPVIPQQALPPSQSPEHVFKHGDHQANAGLEEAEIKSPPRGRSKARGRSSTSRRSVSPPRGVARRGRSTEMLMFEANRVSTSPVKDPKKSAPRADALLPGDSDADNESDQDDRSSGKNRDHTRRGRSPTERGRALVQARHAQAPITTFATPLPLKEHQSVTQSSAIVDNENESHSTHDSSGYDEVHLDEL